MKYDNEFRIRGMKQCELAREIVMAGRNRLQWQGGFGRKLECEFVQVCGTFEGTLSVSDEDLESLERVAADAASYYQARRKPGLMKTADGIRSMLAECRINASYLRTFAGEGGVS